MRREPTNQPQTQQAAEAIRARRENARKTAEIALKGILGHFLHQQGCRREIRHGQTAFVAIHNDLPKVRVELYPRDCDGEISVAAFTGHLCKWHTTLPVAMGATLLVQFLDNVLAHEMPVYCDGCGMGEALIGERCDNCHEIIECDPR